MSEPESVPERRGATLPDFVERARDTITVKRVFGEPFERDGTTVIPAATVWGGGGGGTGIDKEGQEGVGGGFGLHARPVGALVIRDGDVRWEPAADPQRKIVAVAAVSIVGMLVARSVLKRALRRRRRHR